jgi:hypothetical protein
MCQPKLNGMRCVKGAAMKREEWVLLGAAVAVRLRLHGDAPLAALARRGACVASKNGVGAALFIPRTAPLRLPITRHTLPSNFVSNSLKTKKSGPYYSTHNSRGHNSHLSTSSRIDLPNFRQVQVN